MPTRTKKNYIWKYGEVDLSIDTQKLEMKRSWGHFAHFPASTPKCLFNLILESCLYTRHLESSSSECLVNLQKLSVLLSGSKGFLELPWLQLQIQTLRENFHSLSDLSLKILKKSEPPSKPGKYSLKITGADKRELRSWFHCFQSYQLPGWQRLRTVYTTVLHPSVPIVHWKMCLFACQALHKCFKHMDSDLQQLCTTVSHFVDGKTKAYRRTKLVGYWMLESIFQSPPPEKAFLCLLSCAITTTLMAGDVGTCSRPLQE